MTSEGQDNVLEIFASFNRYKFLMHEETTNVPYTAETCAKLLRIADIDEDETWAMGKTKVYNMHDFITHFYFVVSFDWISWIVFYRYFWNIGMLNDCRSVLRNIVEKYFNAKEVMFVDVFAYFLMISCNYERFLVSAFSKGCFQSNGLWSKLLAFKTPAFFWISITLKIAGYCEFWLAVEQRCPL